ARRLTIGHVSSLRSETAGRFLVTTETDEHRRGSCEWLQPKPFIVGSVAPPCLTAQQAAQPRKPERCGENLSLIVMRPAGVTACFLKTSSIVDRRSLWTRRLSYMPPPPESFWRQTHRPWRRGIQARESPAV